MKRFLVVHIVLITAAISIAAGFLIFKNTHPVSEFIEPETASTQVEQTYIPKTRVLEEANFKVQTNQDFYRAAIENPRIDGQISMNVIRGGIVPHHDVAGDMMAGFFKTLSENTSIHTVFILAPNHSDEGLHYGISAPVRWHTDAGVVTQNNSILDSFVKDGWIGYDLNTYLVEHSIAVLTPYIAKYLPNVEIVPILIDSQFERKNIEKFADILATYMEDPGVGIIGSIDFSHYLSSQESIKNDQVTLDAIASRDYDLIEKMNSDYVDSPLSLIGLLMVMDRVGADKLEVLAHDELGGYVGYDVMESTSYFSIIFGS